jgi:hypothetical protein
LRRRASGLGLKGNDDAASNVTDDGNDESSGHRVRVGSGVDTDRDPGVVRPKEHPHLVVDEQLSF